MATFNEFVQTELPKRPFADDDGLPGQIPVRGPNPAARLQLVWADAPVPSSTSYTAALAISGHVGVALDANGMAIAADAGNPLHQLVEGIALNSAGAGGAVNVATAGTVEHLGWAFSAGQPVFLGLDGALTQALPPTALFVKVIGLAVSPTRLKVGPQPAIFI